MNEDYVFRPCSVARTLQILGDKWIFLIVREAFFGMRYYAEFRENLGIATNILSDRLGKLVEHGILKKVPDENDGRRSRYRLTRKGIDLYPITLALMKWGDEYLAGDEGPPLELHHTRCGEKLLPVTACAHCGEEVSAFEITWRPGPGAGGGDAASG